MDRDRNLTAESAENAEGRREIIGHHPSAALCFFAPSAVRKGTAGPTPKRAVCR